MKNNQVNPKMVQQLLNETVYSRSTIKDLVREELVASMPAMGALINHADSLIQQYMSKQFFHQKQVHINRLRQVLEEPEQRLEAISIAIVNVMSKNGQQPIQSVVGDVSKFIELSDEYYSLNIAADLVACMSKAGLFTCYAAATSETGTITVSSNFSLRPEIVEKIEKKMYLPPLIVEPKEVKRNRDTGYYKEKGSVILGKGNHHDYPLALDALNIANSVAMSIDERMLELFEETSPKPLDTQQKVDNFERLKKQSMEVYRMIIDSGNVFYNTHKYDERGRMYSQGYHLHIQSFDYKKSLIRLAKKETIPLD